MFVDVSVGGFPHSINNILNNNTNDMLLRDNLNVIQLFFSGIPYVMWYVKMNFTYVFSFIN